MRDEGIKALSESELEAQVILQRMKDYDQRLTAEQAAEHISKLNQTRDEAVKIAEDNYEKNIREITKLRDEAGVLTAEQADIMIENAKKQKEEIIQKAEDTRLGAIDKIRSLHSELDDVVDTGTGKILSWWDKLKRWWSGWQPESKSFNVAGNFSSGRRRRSAVAAVLVLDILEIITSKVVTHIYTKKDGNFMTYQKVQEFTIMKQAKN